MKNRIDHVFETKKERVLSVYFTAGFPELKDTVPIIEMLQSAGCDMIEIGMPFSDPLADGPVIQNSGTIALHNGMSVTELFQQLKDIRNTVHIPLVLMGYYNPVIQYGFDKFCAQARAAGIDGLIIPDMPPDVYAAEHIAVFEKYKLHNIMLITPRTDHERIRLIENLSGGFIYAVASSSTTGKATSDTGAQLKYFERLKQLNLKLPVMAGFGISNFGQFKTVCHYVQGAVIGTAFIKEIEKNRDLKTTIPSFIQSLLYDHSIGA